MTERELKEYLKSKLSIEISKDFKYWRGKEEVVTITLKIDDEEICRDEFEL